MRTNMRTAILILAAIAAFAQVRDTYPRTPAVLTVATLPASPATNTRATISDGASATDCTTGGGSTVVDCRYTGSAWTAAPGGSGSGTVTEVQAGEGIVVIDGTTTPTVSTDSAIIPRFYTGAGAPLSNCTEGEFYTDTTNDRLYTCVATDTWGYLAKITIATTAPGTCTVGDLFFDSDASAGSNLFGCTSTDTFTALGGGSVSTQERSIFLPSGFRNTVAGANVNYWSYSGGITVATYAPGVLMTFPDAADTWAFVGFLMPNDWNGGPVKVIIHSVANQATAAQTFVMRASVNCVNQGAADGVDHTDAVSGTFSTTFGSGNELDYWTISSITARNCTAGERGYVGLGRLGTDGADISTLLSAILSVELRYVSNQ